MFDQEIDHPRTHRLYTRKFYAKYVTWLFVMVVGGAIYVGYLSDKEARIAQKEKVVYGQVLKISDGKRNTVDYSFMFEGKSYRGPDSGSYLGLSVGHSAKVWLDPDEPTANGLRDFKFRSDVNHDSMILALYGSVGFAIVSMILWFRAS
jgi:hypothetical protein